MLTNIKKRQLERDKQYSSSNAYLPLFESVKVKHRMHSADMLFREHLLETDSDFDQAIIKGIDLYLEMYEYEKVSTVRKLRQYVLESITKVRDANQLQTYLKRKIALHKNRLKNKIDSAIDKVKDASKFKTTISSTSSNHSTPSSPESQQVAVEESLNMFISLVNEICTYDRIIKNHEKISKRFSIDKAVFENVMTVKDATDYAVEVAKLIDTYKFPTISKFKIATEEYLYTLSKNSLHFNTKDVVTKIAEYYRINCEDPKVYKVQLEGTLKELTNYTLLNEVDIENYMKKSEEDTTSTEIDNIKLLSERVAEYIDDYCEASSLETWKVLLEKISKDAKFRSYDFIRELCDTLRLHKTITDEHIKSLLDMIEENIKHPKFNYKVDMPKLLTQYKDNLLNTAEQFSEVSKDTIDYIKNFIDSNDEVLKSYSANDVDKNNITTLAEKLDILEASIENLDRITPESLLGYIHSNIPKYSNDAIDAVTEMSLRYPAFIDPNSLIALLESELQNTRKLKTHCIDKYIRIDCIKDNITNLKDRPTSKGEEELNVDTCSLLDKEILNTKILETLRVNIVDFYLQPSVLNEMNVISTINVAVEKFKKKLSELSDAEANLSRQFDAQMDSFKGSVINTEDMKAEDREKVISGTMLPKASRIVKLAIGSGLAYMVNPALAVLGILVYVAMSLDNQSKERQKVLDELEIEIDMCNRYIKKAEDANQLEKIRELQKIKKKLESERAKLKYKMIFKHGETPANYNKTGEDD